MRLPSVAPPVALIAAFAFPKALLTPPVLSSVSAPPVAPIVQSRPASAPLNCPIVILTFTLVVGLNAPVVNCATSPAAFGKNGSLAAPQLFVFQFPVPLSAHENVAASTVVEWLPSKAAILLARMAKRETEGMRICEKRVSDAPELREHGWVCPKLGGLTTGRKSLLYWKFVHETVTTFATRRTNCRSPRR